MTCLANFQGKNNPQSFFFFTDYILDARKDYSQATFRIATYQSVSFDIVILTAS